MEHMAEMFRSGGIWMYLIAMGAMPAYLLALATFVLAIPAAVSGKLRKQLVVVSVLTVISGLILIGLGFFGYQMGLADMNAALEAVRPENRQEMMEKGREMAQYPLTFATWLAPLPTILGVLGLVAYGTSREKSDA